MSDQHLGEELHDLLDNRLSATRTAASMRHLDECADCRMRWNDIREAREALQTSSAGIDLTFSQNLLNRDRIAEIARDESKQQARAARGKDKRPMLAVLIIFVAFSTSVGAAYVAGTPAEVSLEFVQQPALAASGMQAAAFEAAGPPQSQSLQSGTSEAAHPHHESATVAYMGPTSMRGGESLRRWVHPDWKESRITPVEAAVVTTRGGEMVLVASVLFDRHAMVITEQHGQLSSALTEHAESVDLGHTDAYIVSESPWQLVWQTGDVVISATCSCPLATLQEVAECFPAQEDPNFTKRVVDGFRELTGFAAQ